jgi:hypothetical protein
MDSGLAAFAAIRKTPATYNPGSGERRLLVRGHAFQRDVLDRLDRGRCRASLPHLTAHDSSLLFNP